jgi:hypothetical protein
MSLQTRTETTPPTWLKTSKSCASCTLSCRSPTYSEVAGNAAPAAAAPAGAAGEPPPDSDADPAAAAAAACCPCAAISDRVVMIFFSGIFADFFGDRFSGLGFDKGWGLSRGQGRAPNGGVARREKRARGRRGGGGALFVPQGQNPRRPWPSDRVRTPADGVDRNAWGGRRVRAGRGLRGWGDP